MDHKIDDLWQGGPWEQPAPLFTPPPAVTVPSGAPSSRRPVLRTRRKRRIWPRLLALLLLIGGLIALTLFLDQRLGGIHIKIPIPSPNPPQQGEVQAKKSEELVRPTIPQAPTGTGVTIDLLPAEDTPLSYSEIYTKCLPSTVSVQIRAGNGRLSPSGSGIIMTEDGYILTNAHVISDTDQVQILLSDNRLLPAQLVGFAPEDDLAVLKVDATGLTPAQFGDSDLLQCGDPVAALGDSLGYRATLTEGIISALNREMDMDDSSMLMIQTSAAINYGNSGGALINQYGQVVGITVIKLITYDGSAESMGFAIPSQRFQYVANALIAGKEIRPAAFGITVSSLPVAEGGLKVLDVDVNSDAWAKGLRPEDRLVTMEGVPLTDSLDMAHIKQSRGPGDTVSFTYIRAGVESSIEIALMDADDVTYSNDN